MWIAIPAGEKDFAIKEEWINLPTCKKLKRKKRIEFGFQIAGKPFLGLEKICKKYPVGLHLPAGIADRWEKEDKKELLAHLSSLDLRFVVIHGKRVGKQAPDYFDLPPYDIERYISRADAKEYLMALDEMEAILKDFKAYGIPITIETVAFNNFDFNDGIWQPATHIDLRVGNYTEDLLEMRKRAGCDIVNDIQHLSFSLNFAHWKHNYAFLRERLDWKIPDNISFEEKMVLEKYHIFLRRGEVPLVKAGTLEEEVEAIGARIYHLSGCHQGMQIEIKDGKVASHDRIGNDDCFRTILKMVLLQNPETLVIEVSGSDDNPCWRYRPPTLDLQKQSLESLCKSLLEGF